MSRTDKDRPYCVRANDELEEGRWSMVHGDNVKLRIFATVQQLPVLERKWSVIDVDYQTRTQRYELLRPQVLTMLRAGRRSKEIVATLGCTYSYITNVKRDL